MKQPFHFKMKNGYLNLYLKPVLRIYPLYLSYTNSTEIGNKYSERTYYLLIGKKSKRYK